MILTICLIVLAFLGYLDGSLRMLSSVGGIAVAVWMARRGTIRAQMVATVVGALVAGLAAEVIHVVYHILQEDQPGHFGFWVSSVLVSLINAAVVLPGVWLDYVRLQRKRVAP